MKKLLLLIPALALALVSCDTDDPKPIDVASVTVTPGTFELSINEALPQLNVVVSPENADDPTVTWSSDKPAIISVNASTGVLKFEVTEVEEQTAVTITAKAGDKTGICVITIKGKVKVASVTVTPGDFELFVGEALPQLEAVVSPDNADDPTVTWSSDKPAIISVNASTGVLKMEVTGDIEGKETVTITAKAGDNKTGTCVITLKGEIERYGILDFSEECGLLVIDRNIGATAAYSSEATDNSNAIGNFYQFGRNVAVATGAADKADNFIADWSAQSTGYVDWSNPENTPCPKGWGLPSQTQFRDLITNLVGNFNYDLVDYDMISEAEYEEGRAAWKKLLVAKTGAFRTADTKYLPGAEYFWGGFLHTNGNPRIYQYNLFPMGSSEAFSTAMPIRCVKAAN